MNADDLYRAVNLDPSVLLDSDNRIPFAQVVDCSCTASHLEQAHCIIGTVTQIFSRGLPRIV